MLQRYDESHAPDTSLSVSQSNTFMLYKQNARPTETIGSTKNTGEGIVDHGGHSREVVEGELALSLDRSREGGR